ncbi:unnamed protein product [Caenorhabditis auriculariae]|uniref:palmitoyl-protein hydrolase n=1 Tax=Caenorhabditis auriculariae TaxID=2777116 RepID=A0A8S1GPQ9_9PELO|nr:unnamed protein product [Caenorhabditis auriculariae]
MPLAQIRESRDTLSRFANDIRLRIHSERSSSSKLFFAEISERSKRSDVLHMRNNIKGHAKRRLVCGVHENLTHFNAMNVRAVVFASNIDDRDQKKRIPFIRAATKRTLSRCVQKFPYISLIGVLDFQGIPSMKSSKNGNHIPRILRARWMLARSPRLFNRLIVPVLATSPLLIASSSSSFHRSAFLPLEMGSAISSLSSRPYSSHVEMNNGDPEVVPAKGSHTSTVIFLHGLGDQGHGWAEMFRNECRISSVKYICPHSSSRSVTLNMGMSMPAWYDIIGLDANSEEDSEGIQRATRYVHELIDSEVAAGIPPEKICVGVMPGSHAANLNTPIFLGHGTMDFLVPFPIGQMSEQFIKKFNPNVELHSYQMAHSSCNEEIRDLKEFLKKHLV